MSFFPAEPVLRSGFFPFTGVRCAPQFSFFRNIYSSKRILIQPFFQTRKKRKFIPEKTEKRRSFLLFLQKNPPCAFGKNVLS